jgi:hypothetical protein
MEGSTFLHKMKQIERLYWTEIITPDDIDKHLANIGQAEVNANLVVNMFEDYPLASTAQLLVAGAGTGQMFDYISIEDIGNVGFTFADINQNYLDKLCERVGSNSVTFNIVVDDIEKPQLSQHYDATLAVLVLQHIDWRKGVEGMASVRPTKMYFIIQEQACDQSITTSRDLPPTIEKYAKDAEPNLVNRDDLIAHLDDLGYSLLKTYIRKVPDEKEMVGLVVGSTLTPYGPSHILSNKNL